MLWQRFPIERSDTLRKLVPFLALFCPLSVNGCRSDCVLFNAIYNAWINTVLITAQMKI
jgi:hypothetical protein